MAHRKRRQAGETPETEVTEEMIKAGLAQISGFELKDAWDGFLDKRELVTAIYGAMARAASLSR